MRHGIVLILVLLACVGVWYSRPNQAIANPVPDPDPAWNNPVNRLGSELSVGEPRSYRNLLIFPLSSDEHAGISLVTLDRALRRGDVEIREKGSGTVNAVRLRNTGKSLVFGLSGDMIVGAKQDRMLRSDVLIPPNSGWLEVEVYCTEHGRWSAKTERFGTNDRVVPGALRAKAAQTESQSEVWAGVAEAKDALGTGTGGTALRGIYDDEGTQDRAKAYVSNLMPVPEVSARTIGVLVAVGDEILCADVFASHELFSAMWEKLLRSYAMDALSRPSEGRLSTDDAREFIRTLEDASLDARSTPGLGRLYRVSTSGATGSALVHDDRVIHLDLFPGWAEKNSDRPDGRTPNLDWRRRND